MSQHLSVQSHSGGEPPAQRSSSTSLRTVMVLSGTSSSSQQQQDLSTAAMQLATPPPSVTQGLFTVSHAIVAPRLSSTPSSLSPPLHSQLQQVLPSPGGSSGDRTNSGRRTLVSFHSVPSTSLSSSALWQPVDCATALEEGETTTAVAAAPTAAGNLSSGFQETVVHSTATMAATATTTTTSPRIDSTPPSSVSQTLAPALREEGGGYLMETVSSTRSVDPTAQAGTALACLSAHKTENLFSALSSTRSSQAARASKFCCTCESNAVSLREEVPFCVASPSSAAASSTAVTPPAVASTTPLSELKPEGGASPPPKLAPRPGRRSGFTISAPANAEQGNRNNASGNHNTHPQHHHHPHLQNSAAAVQQELRREVEVIDSDGDVNDNVNVNVNVNEEESKDEGGATSEVSHRQKQPPATAAPKRQRTVSSTKTTVAKKQEAVKVEETVLPGEWGQQQVERSRAEPDPIALLSDEQKDAFDLVVRQGRSVFITGGAGTGKSFLLRTIIKKLPRSGVFVTATTGIAALNLGGTTVHSFAGCGIVEENAEWSQIASRIYGNKSKKEMWRRCKVLIVDEISMLSAFMFDMLEYVARVVRGNAAPFGGIQLVLTGDFLQLPPVRKKVGSRTVKGPSFPFESEIWLKVNPQVCLLSKPYRQRNTHFFHMLNEMRFGEMSAATVDELLARSDIASVNVVREMRPEEAASAETNDLRRAAVSTPDNVRWVDGKPPVQRQYVFASSRGDALRCSFDGYTILRSKRDEVEQQNSYYYRLINPEGNPEYIYQGFYEGKGEYPDKSILKTVCLRVGCRVMLIKNLDVLAGLVNGTTGTLTGFVDLGKRMQCRNGSSVTVTDIRAVCRGKNGDLHQRHSMLPVVDFELPSQKTKLSVVVEPDEWKEEQGDKVVSRTVQIPLIMAYAITIHKSQGMSLTQVDIDLRSVFEAGQAYVALSRCTDLEKVRLHSFNPEKVRPDGAALAYYKALTLFHKRMQWQRQRRLRLQEKRAAEARQEPENEESPSRSWSGPPPPPLPPSGLQEDDRASGLLAANDYWRRQSLTPYGYASRSAYGEHLPPVPLQNGLPGRRVRGGRETDYYKPKRKEETNNKDEDGERHAKRSRRDGHDTRTRDGSGRESSSDDDADDEMFRDNLGVVRRPYSDEMDPMAPESESTYIEELRQYTAKMLDIAKDVRALILRLGAVPRDVQRTRLVLDTTAMFYLMTGSDSAAVFHNMTVRNENMLRLPQVVKRFLVNLADSVNVASQERTRRQQLQPREEAHHPCEHAKREGASTADEEQDGTEAGEEDEDTCAAMHAFIDIAADALALVDEWQSNFILDEQREQETVSLMSEAVVLPAWYKFASILPLLQPLIPGWGGSLSQSLSGGNGAGGGHKQSPEAMEAGWSMDSVSEVAFLLNRDPREALTHRDILEYALFLDKDGGSRIVICTDSPTLAAYALALDFPIVPVGNLAIGR